MPDCGGKRGADRGSAGPLAALVHPVTLAALVVLVVNDHVLKSRFPGVITGKASDLAGLVLMPAVSLPWWGLVGGALTGEITGDRCRG
jgi:hypothetical protein